MAGSVISLNDVCFYFILNRVRNYSLAALSRLPWYVRRHLLSFLPAVDIWRLETCSEYVQDLDMEAVWKERIATHITPWKAQGPDAVEQETMTAREAFLNYVTRLLLSSTSGEKASSYNRRVPYSLHRVLSEKAAVARLRDKYSYLEVLLYSIHMVDPPALCLHGFTSCDEYYLPNRCSVLNSKRYPHWREYETEASYKDQATGNMVNVSMPGKMWLPKVLVFLMQSSGWMPKKLEVFPPSIHFLESMSDETVLKFLSRVEEISIPLFITVDISELADVLAALFGVKIGLTPTSITITTKYRFQISLILSRLAKFCGCSSNPLYDQSTDGHSNIYSSFQKITISTLESQQPTGHFTLTCTTDWAAFLCHDAIETIRLIGLKSSIPASLPSLLSHLLATRPSMRLVELTGCSIPHAAMETLVTSFLFTTTSHPQSLIIKQWQPPTDREVQLMSKQKRNFTCADSKKSEASMKGPCKSGENKILCLPVVCDGPCSLQWLLGLPSFSVKTTEFTVGTWGCHYRLSELLSILKGLGQNSISPIPNGSITVTIESPIPPDSVDEHPSAGVIHKIAMSPLISDIQLVKV